MVAAATKAAEEGGGSVVKIVPVAAAAPTDTAKGKEGMVLVSEAMVQQAVNPPLVGTVWLVGVAAIALALVESACETMIMLLERDSTREYQHRLDV